MSDEEKLRALLAEAREWVELNGKAGCPADKCEECVAVDEMLQRIDAALAEPVEGMAKAWEKDRQLAVALFEEAKKVERERDEARAEVARLRWGNEMVCENTPTKGCECPGCGLARERAERGEVGP